jgi:UDP-GlcNAc:undecaprenyl-phosphate GlcNAc-1-phosphate transferase
MADYAIVFAVAAVGTFLATWPVRTIAVKLDLVDYPNERSVHKAPIPLGGGAAMLVAFLAAMVVASRLAYFHQIFQHSTEPLGVLAAAAAIFAVGMLDDLRPVSAPAKMAGQVVAASILYFSGVTMFYFKIPFAGVVSLSPAWLPLLTAIWVVVMANAVNLVDGLDGLAAGIVGIGSAAFFLYAHRLIELGALPTSNIGPLIAAIVFGMCAGFLPHNFNPARIMMGDAGAMFLGLLMAASTMVVGGRTTQVPGETYFFFAPLFIPFFILGVPMVDTAFSVVRRTARRSGIATADKDHLHHRLVRLGHGPRRSVAILWAWTAVLSGFVLYPVYAGKGNDVLPFAVVALGVALYTLFHPGLRRGEGGGGEPEPATGASEEDRATEPATGASEEDRATEPATGASEEHKATEPATGASEEEGVVGAGGIGRPVPEDVSQRAVSCPPGG